MHTLLLDMSLWLLLPWQCDHFPWYSVMVLVFSLQHETIEHLLERGEKLNDLVDKTDKLSGASKAFYKEVSSCYTVALR